MSNQFWIAQNWTDACLLAMKLPACGLVSYQKCGQEKDSILLSSCTVPSFHGPWAQLNCPLFAVVGANLALVCSKSFDVQQDLPNLPFWCHNPKRVQRNWKDGGGVEPVNSALPHHCKLNLPNPYMLLYMMHSIPNTPHSTLFTEYSMHTVHCTTHALNRLTITAQDSSKQRVKTCNVWST